MESVLDLGELYPSAFVSSETYKEKGVYSELPKVPLHLMCCTECNLIQLKHTTNLDLMYRQYWYKSSLNKSMIVALQDVVDGVNKRIDLVPGDTVLDIGANDGSLLSLWGNDLATVGFDPALNLAEEASKKCDCFINDYFSLDKYPVKAKAKVITSIAMFYDLRKPMSFIEDIRKVMDKKGIWVIQFTDLLSMFRANAFDNICHEHLEYYSLEVICSMMERRGLEVFDVMYNEVNGGSLRTYVGHRGCYTVQATVDKAISRERNYFSSFVDPFEAFRARVEMIRVTVTNLITEINKDGKRIFVMGASTKGNTLLQYLGLTVKDLPIAAEVNSDKYGLLTVGSGIPIVSEKDALSKNPDYFVVLPWHFIKGLQVIHDNYLRNGGRLIVPMPEPSILEYSLQGISKGHISDGNR
jgi:hypothetical protein